MWALPTTTRASSAVCGRAREAPSGEWKQTLPVVWPRGQSGCAVPRAALLTRHRKIVAGLWSEPAWLLSFGRSLAPGHREGLEALCAILFATYRCGDRSGIADIATLRDFGLQTGEPLAGAELWHAAVSNHCHRARPPVTKLHHARTHWPAHRHVHHGHRLRPLHAGSFIVGAARGALPLRRLCLHPPSCRCASRHQAFPAALPRAGRNTPPRCPAFG